MQQIIPADINDQVIETTLDGTPFQIHLSWNESAQQFYLGLWDEFGAYLVEGVSLVVNTPLLYRYRKQSMPLGELAVVKESAGPLDRRSFAENKAQLYYYSEEDLIAFGVLDSVGRL